MPRVEDDRLLAGRGCFVADLEFPGMLHAAPVRSPHAHARILGIRKEISLKKPGVEACFTGEDLAADGVGPMRALWQLRSADGGLMAEPERWALARGRVRHVGEPVALVLAATRNQALDAAEAVEVEYEPLPAVTDVAASAEPCFRFTRGDAATVEAAFARAAHVVRMELRNQRLCGGAIEPRAVLAHCELPRGAVTLYDATQTPHHIRAAVAAELGVAESALRLVAPDVGGGFGYKGKHYPEETLIAWAARRLGRSVKWVATRNESFVSDTQGRDHLTRAALALDAEGRFLALRVETLANLGAYVSTFGAAIPGPIYTALLAGPYRTPAVFAEVKGMFTHTVPTDAYRGAGRPEACFVLERLADRAARALGLDRAELRRRNLVPRGAMPYRTPLGPVYDSGDFPRLLERVLALADYAGFEARRKQATASGRLRGFGLASYVESSGVAPSRLSGSLGARTGFYEFAEVRVDATGAVRALLGTHSHGQGHATTFAQILAERLGVPLEAIEIVEGDTAAVAHGTGTFGSRSIAVGGSALEGAAAKIIAKCRRIAAHLLEAAEGDIDFSRGEFRVAGTDRSIAFAEVARQAHLGHRLPEGTEPGLQESTTYDPSNFAFSNGAHACEVEIDPETGALRLVGYWAVDDIGTVINPTIVEGQLHGGVAQGAGQAAMEAARYDREGQLLSATFMDYALPRAADLPAIVSELDESQPCTHNPLGAKGCGESGAIGAPAAVVSAALDALAPAGVRDLEMPLTPERIWRALDLAARAQ